MGEAFGPFLFLLPGAGDNRDYDAGCNRDYNSKLRAATRALDQIQRTMMDGFRLVNRLMHQTPGRMESDSGLEEASAWIGRHYSSECILFIIKTSI